MGVGILIGLLLLIALVLFFAWLFIYFKKRKSKIGIVLTLIVLICLSSIFFMNNIDELTITKEDVRKDLKQINIELKSNFEIKENTVSGLPERNQKTVIEISKSEIDKIIDEIKHSENFKEYKNNSDVYNNDISLDVPLNGQVLNIKYPEYYSREFYIEIDNIPTRIFLSVYEGKNILEYQKWED